MAAPSPPFRVLVIDDDPILRELLSALLSAEGHTVSTADEGESALRGLQHGSAVDIMLSDVQLPGLSGSALATQLRAAAPHALLLGMSGSQPAPEVRSAFDGFLLKPFTTADFLAAANAAHQAGHSPPHRPALSGSWALDSEPSPRLSAAAASAPALDEAVFSRLAQSLPPGPLAELYDLTLQDLTARLARMEEARSSHDLDTFRREAHALKGSCGMVGAAELAQLAARAELVGGFSDATATFESFAPAAERLGSILAARFVRNM